MSVQGAYWNKADVRAEAVELVRNQPDVLKSGGAQPDPIFALSEKFALPAALLLLIRTLAETSAQDGSETFQARAFASLAAGAAVDRAVADWFLRLYQDPGIGIEAALASTPAAAPASTIMRMHRHGSASSAEWREARRALTRVRDIDEEAQGYAEIIGAMAWDIDACPGVAVDVVHAGSRHAHQQVDWRFGWTKDADARFMTLHSATVDRAAKALALDVNAAKHFSDADRSALSAEIDRLWEASAEASTWRMLRERSTAMMAAGADWHEVARAHLLHVLQKASTRDVAFVPVSAGEG